jgi:hypothetical protein
MMIEDTAAIALAPERVAARADFPIVVIGPWTIGVGLGSAISPTSNSPEKIDEPHAIRSE